MKKWIRIIIIVACIILFLALIIPKPIGREEIGFATYNAKTETIKNCTCLGFIFDKMYSRSGPIINYCMGIPFSCENACYEATEFERGAYYWEEVPCS